MVVVGMHEAKTHFSKLVKRAAAGEEIVVTNAGAPVAKIIAFDEPLEPRKPGGLEGQIEILPGFDEIPPEFEEYLGD
jgi:prevent-host-death family protein